MADGQKQRLDAVLNQYFLTKRLTTVFTAADAQWLCQSILPILRAEPTILHLASPINVCGDVHGQLNDLLLAFDVGGVPPTQTWLFLGDYVDRGPKSVEVICLLFLFKVRYPRHIFLLRGNHETEEMSQVFGFATECIEKLTLEAWMLFCKTFDYLPLAATVGGSIFCIHGGISPELRTLRQIEDIARPCCVPESGLITDLLWSDPCARVDIYEESDRGSTFLWGIKPAKQFMQRNRLQRIVRAHQVAVMGYNFPFLPDESIVTLFTASKYSPEVDNKAAFLRISEDLEFDFRLLIGDPAPRQRSKSMSEGLMREEARRRQEKSLALPRASPKIPIQFRIAQSPRKARASVPAGGGRPQWRG
jgi:serine/threonine-protein phosphatase PP1 catalytic subunit